LTFFSREAISKVIQKMTKPASQRAAKGGFSAAVCMITAVNAPFRRSKGGHFDNSKEF
jgi:hypothetical protein